MSMKSDEDSIPFISVSNKEIEDAPALEYSYMCLKCDTLHKVESSSGESGTISLQYINCPTTKQTYLIGIQGKEINRG